MIKQNLKPGAMNQHDLSLGSDQVSSRIGVCTWSLPVNSADQLIDRLRELHINTIQLALNPVLNGSDAWHGAIRKLRDAGIWIASGMIAMKGEDYSTLRSIELTGGVRPDRHWTANRALAEEAARLALRECISLITFHAGFIPEDRRSPERAKLVDRLQTICAVFRDHSVDAALETGQETASTLLETLRDVDCPNLGVNFDPANMILYGKGDPVEALRLLAPHVRQVHIKDALPAKRAGEWGREVAIGKGAVDWNAFFDVALALHPPVQFLIEREAGSGRLPDVSAARDLVAYYLNPRKR